MRSRKPDARADDPMMDATQTAWGRSQNIRQAASLWPPNPSISARASIDSPPCADSARAPTLWRAPSTSFATVAGPSLQTPAVRRPRLLEDAQAALTGTPCVVAQQRGRTGTLVGSSTHHVDLERQARPRPDGPGLVGAWLKARPGCWHRPTAATPPGPHTPLPGALAAPPGSPPR